MTNDIRKIIDHLNENPLSVAGIAGRAAVGAMGKKIASKEVEDIVDPEEDLEEDTYLDLDDDKIDYLEAEALEDAEYWLEHGEGKDYIDELLGDNIDDEEKDWMVVDDIIPSIYKIVVDHVNANMGDSYEHELNFSGKKAKAWFEQWCEKNNISIRMQEEAYNSINNYYNDKSIEEDNASDLVNSGAWDKAEKHTKYDPPKTDNKGKSARKGFVG